MPYQKLDRDQLFIKKLETRRSKVYIENDSIPVTQRPVALSPSGQGLIEKTVGRIRSARKWQRSVMLAFGAHTIKKWDGPHFNCLNG
jgi:hypothetical protein